MSRFKNVVMVGVATLALGLGSLSFTSAADAARGGGARGGGGGRAGGFGRAGGGRFNGGGRRFGGGFGRGYGGYGRGYYGRGYGCGPIRLATGGCGYYGYY